METIGNRREDVKKLIKRYAYINIVKAPGPRSNRKQEDIEYLEVLGKKYALHSTSLNRLIELLTISEAEYGNRAKQVNENGICYKSLSHSVRVITEVIELLVTNHINFPLINAKYIKQIKHGDVDTVNTLKFIEDSITKVDSLLKTSTIQESANKEITDKLYLQLIG